MTITTKRGYDFFDCASALQKAIRRSDVKTAAFFALELWSSGYDNYVWKRLFTVSAEDCWGIITQEVDALYNGYMLVNKTTSRNDRKGRIFISKAVILLCQCRKCRDADHLQNLVVDKMPVNWDNVERWLDEVRGSNVAVPEYAFDCHTLRGKKAGKTHEGFFLEEYNSLNPREPGLFDNLVEL